MRVSSAAPGQQMWTRSLLILFAVAAILPTGSNAQGLQRNITYAPAPGPFLSVLPSPPPPSPTATPPSSSPSPKSSPSPAASTPAAAPSSNTTATSSTASPSPVAQAPAPTSSPRSSTAPSPPTASPPSPAVVAASPPTSSVRASPPAASYVASGTSASSPSPAVTASPPSVVSSPPPSPLATASPPSPAIVTSQSPPTAAPTAAILTPPASPPAAANTESEAASTPAVAVRQLAGAAAPPTAEPAAGGAPAAAAPTGPNGSTTAQSPSNSSAASISAFNYTAPAPAPRLAFAPTGTPTSAAGSAAAVPTPAAARVGTPPTAAPTGIIVTIDTPTPVAAPDVPGPTVADAAAAIESALGPDANGAAPVSAPDVAAAIARNVRTAAAPALTGNYLSAGAPAPGGAILAAPAPGNNDAAQLAGQPTTTLDAEILISGSGLTPFDTSKEQATANSVKAVLANYTTVVRVNGATPRGTTAPTPVSGPGLPPGSTESITFVPSGAPTPPSGSVSISISPASGRRLLATTQESVQVNITVTTNTANATAVQQAINDAINDGQLAATLQAAGLNATDVSAVSINVIAVNAPPPPPPPSSPTNTAPAIAPAPKSGTPTGAIVGAVVGGVVGAAAIVTVLYCCIAARSRRRNRELEAGQARLSSKESYDSGSSDEAHKLPAFFPGGKPKNGLAQIRTGKLGGKADPLRASSEVLSSSEYSSTDYTDSNEKVLHGSGHIAPTVASSDVASPGATSIMPGQSTDIGSEDTALAGLVRGGSDMDGALLPGGGKSHVNANLWQIMWKDLNVQKQIGEGSFGKVYLAKWRETTVAAKILLGGSTNSTDEEFPNRDSPLLEGLTKEAGMMASLRHPNVVMYLGVCMDPPCVITEYCARGSLNDVLKRARYVPALAMQLDWPRRLNMCLDAAKGMMYLHSSDPPIIHRDLKSPNLLVDKHWRVKVCDFNLSRVMEETVVLSSMAASNPRWLAPEILSGRGYTYSSDVYSFGIIMWEFLTWRVPWHECGPWQVVALVTEGSARPEIPPVEAQPSKTFPGYEDYIKLMQRCWAQDPEARPDFAQIISALRKLLASEMQLRQKEEKATIMS